MFLREDEPAPVEVLNADSGIPLVLVCDHASARFPRSVGDLGVSAEVRRSHLAVDIGAAAVARHVAANLGVTAVLAGYSRLVVDCNRYPEDALAFLEFGDGVAIVGNRKLSAAHKQERIEHIFKPYHRAIEAQVARLARLGQGPAVVGIHSFTPVFEGVPRPWDIGVLWDSDGAMADILMRKLEASGLVVGDNQPYSGAARLNYTLKRHGAALGLPHACIEMRQDHLGDPAGIERMARALGPIVGSLPGALFRTQPRSDGGRQPAAAQASGQQRVTEQG